MCMPRSFGETQRFGYLLALWVVGKESMEEAFLFPTFPVSLWVILLQLNESCFRQVLFLKNFKFLKNLEIYIIVLTVSIGKDCLASWPNAFFTWMTNTVVLMPCQYQFPIWKMVTLEFLSKSFKECFNTGKEKKKFHQLTEFAFQ